MGGFWNILRCRGVRVPARNGQVVILALAMALAWGLDSRLAAQATVPRLARGVLTVVSAEVTEEDTVSGPRPLPELLQVATPWTPHYSPASDTLHEMAQNVTIRRAIWQFEFAAKPLRLVNVEIDGQTRQVWYLLYQLRNVGELLRPVSPDGGRSHTLERMESPLRFLPQFVLKDHEHGKSYYDRVIPEAVMQIQQIELRDPSIRLYDSISISNLTIDVSTESVDRSVWGVATWTDIDRRADFISVYVQGLTNAYRWEDVPDGGRQFTFKTLQLNYWRPGDARPEAAGEIRVGLPTFPEGPELDRALRLYEMTEREAFTWVFRE